MNLLQAGIVQQGRAGAGRLLSYEPCPIDRRYPQARFVAAFNESGGSSVQNCTVLLDTWFYRYRQSLASSRLDGNAISVIGKLRSLLAEVCVGALEPDLVILDEFQRFKELLDPRNAEKGTPRWSWRKSVVRDRRPTTASACARCCFLQRRTSSTPPTQRSIRRSTMSDFLATTRFLLGEDDDARRREVKRQLSRFGAALKRAAGENRIRRWRSMQAKRDVEVSLRNVMARTERVGASEDRDAMVAEDRSQATGDGDGCAPVPRSRCAVPRRRRPRPDAVLEVGALSRELHARLSVQ